MLPRRIARPPWALSGASTGSTTFWPGVSTAPVGLFADRPAGDRDLVLVEQATVLQVLEDQRHPAGGVEVGRDVVAAGLQVGQQRSAAGDCLEVVDLELDPGLAGDREQVEHAVGRAAGGADHRRSRSRATCG